MSLPLINPQKLPSIPLCHAWVKIATEMAGEISIFLCLARFGCNEDGIGKAEENGMLVIILKVVTPRTIPKNSYFFHRQKRFWQLDFYNTISANSAKLTCFIS